MNAEGFKGKVVSTHPWRQKGRVVSFTSQQQRHAVINLNWILNTPLLAFMTYNSGFWSQCTQAVHFIMFAQIKPIICTPGNSSHLPMFYSCLKLTSQIYEHRHCFLCYTIYSVMCIFFRWFPIFFFPHLNKLFLAEFTTGKVFRILCFFKRMPIVQYPVWWHNLTLVCCSTWWFWNCMEKQIFMC